MGHFTRADPKVPIPYVKRPHFGTFWGHFGPGFWPKSDPGWDPFLESPDSKSLNSGPELEFSVQTKVPKWGPKMTQNDLQKRTFIKCRFWHSCGKDAKMACFWHFLDQKGGSLLCTNFWVPKNPVLPERSVFHGLFWDTLQKVGQKKGHFLSHFGVILERFI